MTKRLSRSLAKTLAAIKPYDGDEEFMRELLSQRSPIEGYSPKRLVHDIGELQDKGMLRIFVFNGKPDSFDLTSEGRDYRRNRMVDVAKIVGKQAFQLLVGASGGLVVLLVGRALGQ